MNRRRFTQALLASLTLPMVAPLAASPVEGRDWRRLSPPQPRPAADRIEVLEFFSYGCPHCSDLNLLIKPWAAALPEDVTFRRVPVTFGRGAWERLARLFHALEYSEQLEALDQRFFDALHRERQRLTDDRAILDWVAAQGVERKAFEEIYRSFAVEVALGRSRDLEGRYRIDAVPRIVVDGRFVVVGEGVGSVSGLLTIADGLIAMAREQPAQG